MDVSSSQVLGSRTYSIGACQEPWKPRERCLPSCSAPSFVGFPGARRMSWLKLLSESCLGLLEVCQYLTTSSRCFDFNRPIQMKHISLEFIWPALANNHLKMNGDGAVCLYTWLPWVILESWCCDFCSISSHPCLLFVHYLHLYSVWCKAHFIQFHWLQWTMNQRHRCKYNLPLTTSFVLSVNHQATFWSLKIITACFCYSGMKFLEDCPIQPLIPLYLLVGGVVGSLKVLCLPRVKHLLFLHSTGCFKYTVFIQVLKNLQ